MTPFDPQHQPFANRILRCHARAMPRRAQYGLHRNYLLFRNRRRFELQHGVSRLGQFEQQAHRDFYGHDG